MAASCPQTLALYIMVDLSYAVIFFSPLNKDLTEDMEAILTHSPTIQIIPLKYKPTNFIPYA